MMIRRIDNRDRRQPIRPRQLNHPLGGGEIDAFRIKNNTRINDSTLDLNRFRVFGGWRERNRPAKRRAQHLRISPEIRQNQSCFAHVFNIVSRRCYFLT